MFHLVFDWIDHRHRKGYGFYWKSSSLDPSKEQELIEEESECQELYWPFFQLSKTWSGIYYERELIKIW